MVVANLPGLTGISAEIKLQDGETSSTDLHLKLSAVQEQRGGVGVARWCYSPADRLIGHRREPGGD